MDEYVIKLRLDASGALNEFKSVEEAGQAVQTTIQNIRSSSNAALTETGRFFDDSQQSITQTFNRINAIDEKLSDSHLEEFSKNS